MYGMKFDDFGKPLVYYFFQKNPSDRQIQGIANIRIPVDAKDVLHIFQRDRPGQWRGIPKLAPVLLSLYEIDELMDATLVRQKMAQAVGWIIKKTGSGALPLLGNIGEETEENADGGQDKIQKITPGGVHYLQADEDFTFASIDDIGANMTVFLQHQMRIIASALDVTYEQLTGDLSGVNFSSIRAGLVEFRRRVAVTQQLIFINLGMKPLVERFQEFAGLYESKEMLNAKYKFVLPKTEWVDPLKDAQADVLEIRAGLATLEEKLAERGVEDFDLHMAQLAKEQKLDIILDSNPEHNTQAKVDVTNPSNEPATKEKPKPTETKPKPKVKK
jgi:lambda family phage portal protein